MQTHECKDFKIDYNLTVYEGNKLRLYSRCIDCSKIDLVPEIVDPGQELDRTDPGYWLDNF